MISIDIIENDGLSALLEEYEQALSHIKAPPFHIEMLYSYSKYLSRLFKSIDPTTIRALKERIEYNNELERNLQQHGNEVESLGDNNSKLILLRIAELLIRENCKAQRLFEIVAQNIEQQVPTWLVANNDNIEFIQENAKSNNSNYIHTIRYSQIGKFFKSNAQEEFSVIDISLDGYNDFLKYYNYDFTVRILLYPPEYEAYESYQRKYQTELETELKSAFREEFTGLKYQAISNTITEKKLSTTIQGIVDSAQQYREEGDFKAIKENPELETPEAMLYIVEYEDTEQFWDELDSSEYVFNEQNKLIRINRIKPGDRIRVYSEKLNVSLFDIAAEEDEETFNLIECYSDLWHNVLQEYYQSNNIKADELYTQLKKQGLSVQPTTLQNYLDKKVRFPMRKSDLEAIVKLTKNEKLEKNIEELLKHKRIYNGVMIALGRNLKEEICRYLQTKELGDILQGTFTVEMLNNFIETSMPLRTVKNIITRIITEQE